jgi:hypothetical protein
VQVDYEPGEQPVPQPFSDENNRYTVKDGEWTFLRIHNNHSNVLNITVLDLQPDWGITQIYPSGAGYFQPLDPSRELTLPLRANLPSGMKAGTDIVKVFATLGTSNFRWLELPPLDRSGGTNQNFDGISTSSPEEPASISTLEGCGTRNLTLASGASNEWVTYQVELQVQRA